MRKLVDWDYSITWCSDIQKGPNIYTYKEFEESHWIDRDLIKACGVLWNQNLVNWNQKKKKKYKQFWVDKYIYIVFTRWTKENKQKSRYISLKSAFNFSPETRFDLCLTAIHADPIKFDVLISKSRFSFWFFFSVPFFFLFVRCERKKKIVVNIFVANIFENSIFKN